MQDNNSNNNGDSPFYKGIDENCSEEYDPRTNMFSDSPYDLNTGAPIQPRIPAPHHIRINKKKELRKLVTPFILSYFLVLPFTVILTFYIKYPVFSIPIPEFYLLIALNKEQSSNKLA